MKHLVSRLLCSTLLCSGMFCSGLSLLEPTPGLGADVDHAPSDVTVGLNRTFVLDYGSAIRRVSVTSGEIADAVPVSETELLLNGKSAGDTSLVIWDARGKRSTYDVHVVANSSKLDEARDELAREVGQDVTLTMSGTNVFLRGTVKDTISADRALNIAATAGKVVNLLRVLVPGTEPQVLLKVRFADVDRSATTQLGANLFGLDNSKGIGSATTGQFGSPPNFNTAQKPANFSVTNLLNIFYYRPDINLGAVLQDLETKQLLQILAEPNLLTVSGKSASFLAGGEFPFPTLQGGGSGVGQITIQFKEFGIRINFLPTITPQGTIRMTVTPEVSSLDYANGLTVSGYTVPGLATRRVQTEVELQSGQSFVIAGLLDNQLTQTMNRLPGFANIPVLGKLFQSRSITKSNTELLVLVTPELVNPIPVGVKSPIVSMPLPFLKGTAGAAPQTPGLTGAAAALPKQNSLPIEQLRSFMQSVSSTGPMSNNTAPNERDQTPALPPIQPALQGTPAPAPVTQTIPATPIN